MTPAISSLISTAPLALLSNDAQVLTLALPSAMLTPVMSSLMAISPLSLQSPMQLPSVGGGPIVRVGDRISIFSPWLTAACASRAEAIFGGAATPRATETARDSSKRPWQRKLMAGGACEASVFCAHGYDATCICLPLGNYHNMPHLAEHQAGTYDPFTRGPARCEREFIHTEDYLGMIDLLVALGHELPGAEGFLNRLDKLYQEKKYVLGGNAQC